MVLVRLYFDFLTEKSNCNPFQYILVLIFLFAFQGVLVFLAAKSGFIDNAEEAAQFQNFIVCVEMLIAAIGHLFAFPYKEYAGANIGGSRGLTGSLAHALKLNDFYHDTVHQVSLAVIYPMGSPRRCFQLLALLKLTNDFLFL